MISTSGLPDPGMINALCLASSFCIGGAEKHTGTIANLLDPGLFKAHPRRAKRFRVEWVRRPSQYLR